MRAEPGPDETRRGRAYCLRCFAAMPEPQRDRCAACGFVSRPSDRKIYWNRNPAIRTVEGTLKLAIAAGVGLLAYLIMAGFPHMGRGAGWAIAAPLLLGVLAWQTASKLTRHGAGWHPAVAWTALLLLACVVPWLLYWGTEHIARWTVVGIDAVLLALASLVRLVARRFDRWKRRRIDGAAS